MITCEKNIFHLKTDAYSYLLSVDDLGILRHLHFGGPVRSSDAPAFVCHSGLGWGSSVVLTDGDSASCLDDKALEWSGSGRGDYRESPLELAGVSSDFRFVEASILEGSPAMESGLPQAHGDCQTLVLTLAQPGAKLTLYYTAFETALTRRAAPLL